jgi:ABC-type Fe3+/spermidine/putrescine transport system ATPase subunit
MGDRLIVMNEGLIEQVGTAQEIFTVPETFFVASFVGDNFIMEGAISATDGTLVTLQTEQGDFTVDTERQLPSNGSNVGFSVRADLISILERENRTADNSLSGTVEFVEYVGYVVKLRVRLDWGAEVIVKETQDVYFQRPFKEGDRVDIGWNARDAVFLTHK